MRTADSLPTSTSEASTLTAPAAPAQCTESEDVDDTRVCHAVNSLGTIMLLTQMQ